MAFSRHNDRGYNLAGEHSFTLWLFLSITLHVFLAVVIVFFHSFQKKNIFYNPTYEVKLLPKAEVARPEEVQQKKEEIRPPEKPEKEKIAPKEIKEKKPVISVKKKMPAVRTKTVKDTARPDDAVAKIKEKIAAEEAVEKIRKKVTKKEPASPGKIKIAARPPTKVYQRDELDAELKAYFDKITRMITAAWSLPETLGNKGFKTILSIHINRDGTVESLFVEEGSGNSLYDESTIRAINKVTPLPPLPKGWNEEAIDLGLRF